MYDAGASSFSEGGTTVKKESFGRRWGLALAVCAMAAVWLLPLLADLPVQGHRLLGILGFAVVIWMTEGVSYPVSAFAVMTLMAFALGMAPDPAHPEALLGTGKALSMALSGFSTSAWALVAGAMFLSAAMMITGLDRRIALLVMARIGVRSDRLVIGVIFVGFLLSFFVPSTTARVSCMVPIVAGIIRAFGLSIGSPFAGVLMMAVAQADSLWNISIKTAAAQNVVAVGFIQQVLGRDISWMEWFLAAAPYAVVLSVVLYFILLRALPPEVKELPGGRDTIRAMLRELGPVTLPEKKLLLVSAALLFFWVTEKKLHPFDTTTVTLAGIFLLMLPRWGVMTWQQAVPHINWGTIALFGVGISLGSAILAELRRRFPHLERVASYAAPRDILRKSPEEMERLREAGLTLLYYGMESGDTETLAAVRKGVTGEESVAAGQRVIAAGMQLSIMTILGLAGQEGSRRHALATARALSAIRPTMWSALSLMLYRGSELKAQFERGEFHPLSPAGLMEELALLVEHVELPETEHCLFRSNHVSNYIPLAATLPLEKERLLADIGRCRDYLASLRHWDVYNHDDTKF